MPLAFWHYQSLKPGIYLLPEPTSLAVNDGIFCVDSRTLIVADKRAATEAEYLRELLGISEYPIAYGQLVQPILMPTIALQIAETGLGPEAYRLTVADELVLVEGGSAAGVFYAIQTLLQLLPADVLDSSGSPEYPLCVPHVVINDKPRFSWRGVMLDVARHFVPKNYLLKFIDVLAFHKLNVLHLHLSDDQGWRIEIKKYPKLTEVGSTREKTLIGHAQSNPTDSDFNSALEKFDQTPHGGFYTQDDMREIVAHAANRHIRVVPEIDIPGHASAAVAAYPELGCINTPVDVSPRWGVHSVVLNGEESTLKFFEDVFEELVDLFPSKYIHAGGDEALRDEWKASESCQKRIKELGLKNEDDLESYIFRRINNFLRSKNRQMIGWDEILTESLDQDVVVMAWRDEKTGARAAQLGHDVVMSPYKFTYLDYYQNENWSTEPLAFRETLTLPQTYKFDALPPGLSAAESDRIIGGQANIWTEYIPTPEQLEYQTFPRLCALSERLWTDDQKASDYVDFLTRLANHLKRLDRFGIKYHPLNF